MFAVEPLPDGGCGVDGFVDGFAVEFVNKFDGVGMDASWSVPPGKANANLHECAPLSSTNHRVVVIK